VREDYSADGDAWSHFPHAHARSRAYRWGEDGIAGISDNHQRLCFGLSLWNGEDPILKERLFGVTGHQGNHGEDVKELYYYLDSTPTHSYMKFLYKYPQRRYPYEELVSENQRRDRNVAEYEILDTDAFDDHRYWDVFVEVCVFAISLSFHIFLIHIPTVCQRRTGSRKPLYSHHILQSWSRSGNIAHYSATLVPQHLVMAFGKATYALFERFYQRRRQHPMRDRSSSDVGKDIPILPPFASPCRAYQ